MIVYKVTNTINGKVYIGYTTKTLEERKQAHQHKANTKSNIHYFYLFKQAIRKYGMESFIWETICKCVSIEECCEKEIHFIKEYNTISPNGYNLTEGGNGGIASQEIKDKISKSVKKYWSENKEEHPWFDIGSGTRSKWANKAWETKRNNGYEPVSGFKRSAESKQKMSETKNEKNKVDWINIITGEEISLSNTKMSEYTGLSKSTFCHIKNGRQKKTKCGWTLK